MEFAGRQVWTQKEVAKLLAVVNLEVRFGEEILENLPAGLLVVAPDLELLAANATLRRLLRLGERPLAELRFEDLFPEEEIRRAVLETFETAGRTASAGSRARAFLRIVARSYGSGPEERKAILLVQEDPGQPALETNAGPRRANSPGAAPRVAAGGLPGTLRAGIILAFVLTAVVRRFLFGPASDPRPAALSPAKVVPFPEPGARVPEADEPRRTATG